MGTNQIVINQFLENHSKEAAEALLQLDLSQLTDFFNEASIQPLLKVIPFINPYTLLRLFRAMEQDKVLKILESTEIATAELLIRRMDKDVRSQILKHLSKEKSFQIKSLLKYPKEAIGSHMDPAVPTMTTDQSVKEAIQTIRANKIIDSQIFVLKPDAQLAGFIHLADLMSLDPEAKIRIAMKTVTIKLAPETPFQSVLNHPGWLNHQALPVVDKTGVFLGVIKLENIRKAAIIRESKVDREAMSTINALGDLYRIGLTGIIKSATEFKFGPSKE